MEEFIARVSGAAALTIEAISILVVIYGASEAFVRLARLVSRPPTTFSARKAVWRRFGTWLLLALEFELAADIIRSVISPSWADIGELGAIAVIRTFLNFFLERDLEHAREEGEPQA